jgi:hypothetical protein
MIITAGLISFGTWLATKLADKGFDYVFNEAPPETLNQKFNEAVQRAYLKLSSKYNDLSSYQVEYFLKHEAVFSEVAKQLFMNSKTNVQSLKSHLNLDVISETLIQDFIKYLKEELLLDVYLGPIFRNNQIYVSIQGLRMNLELIAENSYLTFQELKKINDIISQRLNSQFSFKEFKIHYSENAIRVLSQVSFIGLGVDSSIKRKRKILQDIFVKPYFAYYSKNKNREKSLANDSDEQFAINDEISYREIFREDQKRIVVLGNPGSGKSVLIKSLICDILNSQADKFEDGELTRCIPFRIELRKYLAFKKDNRGNIIKYLTNSLEEEFGIRNLTDSIVSEIIENNETIIFFDGLDEIFKIKDKIEMKNDIENFHTIYPRVRSLTSSRIIGYDEASLDNKNFVELQILNFKESQIVEYITRWYDKEEENEEIRSKEVATFLGLKDQIDNELISNPLLLSLIVILYRNTLKIPESKLEIYQSCTKTLVDKWDVEKDLQIDLDQRVVKEKERILSDLAYWQYEQLSGESIQISYEKAKGVVNNTLRSKLNDVDDLEIEELAESFMNYAEKRSIYFDNNFTHKTFLEYYSAYWIYSNIEKKHKETERNRIISSYITNPFWFIVLELLLNMIDKVIIPGSLTH